MSRHYDDPQDVNEDPEPDYEPPDWPDPPKGDPPFGWEPMHYIPPGGDQW